MSQANEITSRSDPRLRPYLDMKDRDLRREGKLFLAEGMLVVERAVAAGIELVSVLVAPGKAERVRGVVGERVELLICSEDVMRQAAGFALHQGVVAVGRPREAWSLQEVCGGADAGDRGDRGGRGMPSPGAGGRTIVVCPEIGNADNLGLLVRVCAALGVDAMVLGPRCCDPWYRRAVRVSMGAVFTLPIVRSADIDADLSRLRDTLDYELLAAVIDADALPLRDAPRDCGFRGLAILLGSEGYGLPPSMVRQCHRKVRIPMHRDIDSLNVAVAAGIVVHHLVGVSPHIGR